MITSKQQITRMQRNPGYSCMAGILTLVALGGGSLAKLVQEITKYYS
jgi:hypothetical protein